MSAYDEYLKIKKKKDEEKAISDIEKNTQNLQEATSQYDNLNWWEKSRAINARIRKDVTQGFVGLGEGLLDTFAGIGAWGAKVFGNPEAEQKIQDFISRDLTGEFLQTDFFKGASKSPIDWITGGKGMEVGFGDEKFLPDIVEGVAQGVGNVAGTVALGGLGKLGKAATFGGYAGLGVQEATREGASSGEALGYGALSGGTEFATEALVGKTLSKFGIGLNKFAGVIKPSKTPISKGASSALKNILKSFNEEGLEEVMSDIIDPIWKQLTYEEREQGQAFWDKYGELFQENGGAEGLLNSYLVGGLTGSLFEGGEAVAGAYKYGSFKDYNMELEFNELAQVNQEIKNAIYTGNDKKFQQYSKLRENIINRSTERFSQFLDETLQLNELKKQGLLTPKQERIVQAKKELSFETQSEIQRDEAQLGLELAQKLVGDKAIAELDIFEKNADGTIKTDENGKKIFNRSSSSDITNAIISFAEGHLTPKHFITTLAHELGHISNNREGKLVGKIMETMTDEDVNRKLEWVNKFYKKEFEESDFLKKYLETHKDTEENRKEAMKEYFDEEIAVEFFGEMFKNAQDFVNAMKIYNSKGLEKIKAQIANFFKGKKKPKGFDEVMKLFSEGLEKSKIRAEEYAKSKESAKPGDTAKRITEELFEEDFDFETEETKREYNRNLNKESISKLKELGISPMEYEELQSQSPDYAINSEMVVDQNIDADGNKISEGIINRNIKSAVRDNTGAIIPVYHSTPTPGFTIFDANLDEKNRKYYKYKGKIVNFFARLLEMSASYTNKKGIYDPYNRYVVTDVNEILNRKEVKEKIEKALNDIEENGKTAKYSNLYSKVNYIQKVLREYFKENITLQTAINKHVAVVLGDGDNKFFKVYRDANLISFNSFINMLISDIKSQNIKFSYDTTSSNGIYKGYINIEKPLVIDAENQYWNKIKFVNKIENSIKYEHDYRVETIKKGEEIFKKIKKELPKFKESLNPEISNDEFGKKLKEFISNIDKKGFFSDFRVINDRVALINLNNRYVYARGYEIEETINEIYEVADLELYSIEKKLIEEDKIFEKNLKGIEDLKEKSPRKIQAAVDAIEEKYDVSINYIKDDLETLETMFEEAEEYEDYTLLDIVENLKTIGYDKENAFNKFTGEVLFEEDGFVGNERGIKLIYNFLSESLEKIIDKKQEELGFAREMLVTTNDIVKFAIEQGIYDGVIIKNVIDYGGFSKDSERIPSDIYITIKDSAQFKDVNNLNPTDDRDIMKRITEETQNKIDTLEAENEKTLENLEKEDNTKYILQRLDNTEKVMKLYGETIEETVDEYKKVISNAEDYLASGDKDKFIEQYDYARAISEELFILERKMNSNKKNLDITTEEKEFLRSKGDDEYKDFVNLNTTSMLARVDRAKVLSVKIRDLINPVSKRLKNLKADYDKLSAEAKPTEEVKKENSKNFKKFVDEKKKQYGIDHVRNFDEFLVGEEYIKNKSDEELNKLYQYLQNEDRLYSEIKDELSNYENALPETSYSDEIYYEVEEYDNLRANISDEISIISSEEKRRKEEGISIKSDEISEETKPAVEETTGIEFEEPTQETPKAEEPVEEKVEPVTDYYLNKNKSLKDKIVKKVKEIDKKKEAYDTLLKIADRSNKALEVAKEYRDLINLTLEECDNLIKKLSETTDKNQIKEIKSILRYYKSTITEMGTEVYKWANNVDNKSEYKRKLAQSVLINYDLRTKKAKETIDEINNSVKEFTEKVENIDKTIEENIKSKEIDKNIEALAKEKYETLKELLLTKNEVTAEEVYNTLTDEEKAKIGENLDGFTDKLIDIVNHKQNNMQIKNKTFMYDDYYGRKIPRNRNKGNKLSEEFITNFKTEAKKLLNVLSIKDKNRLTRLVDELQYAFENEETFFNEELEKLKARKLDINTFRNTLKNTLSLLDETNAIVKAKVKEIEDELKRRPFNEEKVLNLLNKFKDLAQKPIYAKPSDKGVDTSIFIVEGTVGETLADVLGEEKTAVEEDLELNEKNLKTLQKDKEADYQDFSKTNKEKIDKINSLTKDISKSNKFVNLISNKDEANLTQDDKREINNYTKKREEGIKELVDTLSTIYPNEFKGLEQDIKFLNEEIEGKNIKSIIHLKKRLEARIYSLSKLFDLVKNNLTGVKLSTAVISKIEGFNKTIKKYDSQVAEYNLEYIEEKLEIKPKEKEVRKEESKNVIAELKATRDTAIAELKASFPKKNRKSWLKEHTPNKIKEIKKEDALFNTYKILYRTYIKAKETFEEVYKQYNKNSASIKDADEQAKFLNLLEKETIVGTDRGEININDNPIQSRLKVATDIIKENFGEEKLAELQAQATLEQENAEIAEDVEYDISSEEKSTAQVTTTPTKTNIQKSKKVVVETQIVKKYLGGTKRVRTESAEAIKAQADLRADKKARTYVEARVNELIKYIADNINSIWGIKQYKPKILFDKGMPLTVYKIHMIINEYSNLHYMTDKNYQVDYSNISTNQKIELISKEILNAIKLDIQKAYKLNENLKLVGTNSKYVSIDKLEGTPLYEKVKELVETQIGILIKEKGTPTKTYQAIQKATKDARKEIINLSKTIDRQGNIIDKQILKIEAYESEIDKINLELDVAEQTARELRKQTDFDAKAFHKQENQIKKLTEKLEKIKAGYQEKINALKEDKKELKKKKSEAQENLNKVTKRLENANKTIDNLRTRLEEQKAKTKEVKAQLKETKTEKKSVEKELKITKRVAEKAQRDAEEFKKKSITSFIDTKRANKLNEGALEIIENLGSQFNPEYKVSPNVEKNIAVAVATGDIKKAVDLYIESIENSKYTENGEVKKFSDKVNLFTTEESAEYYQAIEELKPILRSLIDTGKITPLEKAYQRLDNLREARKVDNAVSRTMKKIRTIKQYLDSMLKTGYGGLNKEIVQKILEFQKKLKGDKTIKAYSSSTLRNTLFIDDVNDLVNSIDRLNVGNELKFSDEVKDLVNIMNNAETDSEKIKLFGDFIGAFEKYIKDFTGTATVTLDGEEKKISEWSKETTEQVTKTASDNKYVQGGKSFWNKLFHFVDPRVVFKWLGGMNEKSNMYKFYKQLDNANLRKMEIYEDLFTPIQEFTNKNKRFVKNFLVKKHKDSVTYGDKTIEATTGQLLSLYKTIARKQGRGHLVNDFGGFVIDNKVFTAQNEVEVEQLKIALEEKFDLNNKDSVYRQYLDVVTAMFEKAKQYKVNTDIDLKGFTNVEDGEYYPLFIASEDIYSDLLGKDYGSGYLVGARNFGFNKSSTGTAKAVKIGNIQQIIENYMDQIATYSGFGTTLDGIAKIYNYREIDSSGAKLNNLSSLLENLTQGNFRKFFSTLSKDIQGVQAFSEYASTDETFNKMFRKARGNIAKFYLGFNLRVIVNQLSSIPSALKYVSHKSILKALGTRIDITTKGSKYEEPILGRYRNATHSIFRSESAGEKLSFTSGIERTDQKAIDIIWKACLIETNYDVTKATDIFNKAVQETQPNFNALQRSEFMRTTSELKKAFTLFATQPNKNFSNMVEMYLTLKAKRASGEKLTVDDKRLLNRTTQALLFQGMMFSGISLLFDLLMRGIRDDDDENKAETIAKEIGERFVNDTLLGSIPYINNIFKLDLDKEGLPIKADLLKVDYLDIVNNYLEIWNDPSKAIEPRTIMDTLGLTFGIPLKNIEKYTLGLIGRFIPTFNVRREQFLKGNELDTPQDVKSQYTKQSKKASYKLYTKDMIKLSDEQTNEMYRLFEQDDEVILKGIPKTVTINDEEVKVDKAKFKLEYSKLSNAITKIMRSTQYRTANDTSKATMIKYLINKYYSMAKNGAVGREYLDLNKFERLLSTTYRKSAEDLAYLANAQEIEDTKKLQKYINSLRMTSSEKYLLYYLAGHSLSEEKQKKVISFLIANGMPRKQALQFFEKMRKAE